MAEPATKRVIAFPQRRGREETEFLPAALEIAETPPSPVGRAIGFSIIALFCLAFAWASFGQVDIIALATGKIIPSGKTKIIQAFETGVVRAIHVRDSDAVKAGDVLVELDPTMNTAERNHLHSDLISAQLDVARLRAALSGSADPLAEFHPLAEAPASLVAVQREYLLHQTAELQAKLSALDRQRAQKEAERATITATVAKLDNLIPLIEERVGMRKLLMDRQVGSRMTYLETLQQLVEQRQEREVQASKLHESEAALSAIIETRAQAEAEHQRTLSSELVEAERKVAGLSEDVIKADQRTRYQVLTAPVDGVVQQLAIHTIGGVVTPAQSLLTVVPVDAGLEVEAMISNRDIGFIHAGQTAAIKVDTFPFTRYGLLTGTVLSISQDSIAREKPADKNGDTGAIAESSSEPKGQELVYSARISLPRTQMQVDGRTVNLAPGMAVTAEIKTGARTILSYLLSPLMKYSHDSLRER